MWQARSGSFENKLLVIALVVAAAFFVRTCTDEPVRVVPMQLPRVTLHDASPTVTTSVSAASDRQLIMRLQHEIDSLRVELRRAGGRTTFRTDTLIVSNSDRGPYQIAPDTISVECDETNRTITLSLRPAVRMVPIPQRTSLLGAFLEGGVFYDMTTIEPRMAIGATINITDEMALVVAAEARLRTSLQMRAGLNAALRWTF